MKPVVNPVQKGKKPVVESLQIKNEWLFSFKEFSQLRDFGFSGTDSNWFSALFSRLKDISKLNTDQISKNPKLRDELRYHPIDWSARGMEIRRSDFTWVNKDVVENETEFIFYQFQISQALGRVVGYWQENVFNILLLDRMHNMQPSTFSDYKIRYSAPVETDISALLSEVDRIKRINCTDENCQVKRAVMSISMVQKGGNAVIFFLDNEYLEQLKELADKYSLTVILENGIISTM